jgi:hypothetical protein
MWQGEWTKLTSHELQEPGALYGTDFSLCYVQAKFGPGSLYKTAVKYTQSPGLECILCGPYTVTETVCLLVADNWSLCC